MTNKNAKCTCPYCGSEDVVETKVDEALEVYYSCVRASEQKCAFCEGEREPNEYCACNEPEPDYECDENYGCQCTEEGGDSLWEWIPDAGVWRCFECGSVQ
jgi:hypothetical protein